MDALIQQVATISTMLQEISDHESRMELMDKHSSSVAAQLKHIRVDAKNGKLLLDTVKESSLGSSQKDKILNAVSSRLAECLAPASKPKRSMQNVDDIASFLTASEVAFLQKEEYSLLARVHQVALVFSRIGCWNPSETCVGRAVNMLKQEFQVQELNNAQVFYHAVQDFKTKLRALTKSKTPPNEHIQDYSTPDALPRELFQVAFAKEMPAGFRSTSSMASMGPLRKSSKLLEPSSSSGSGNALNFMQAFQANPLQATMASMMAALACNNAQQNQRQQHGQLKLDLSTPSRRPTLAL